MEELERNMAVVERLMDLVNHGGDIDQFDELCTPDIVNHALAAGRPQGIEGTREFLSSPARQNRLHALGAAGGLPIEGRRRPARGSHPRRPPSRRLTTSRPAGIEVCVPGSVGQGSSSEVLTRLGGAGAWRRQRR